MIEIELNTLPIAWDVAVDKKGHFYNPRAKEKKLIQLLIRSRYTDSQIKGYVVVSFTFIFPIPNSVPISKHPIYLENLEILPTHVDCTNLQKFLEDCVKNIVITDDRNVAEITSKKLYGKKEKILIKIWTLQEYRTHETRC
jgi:Holliday junction resolvase RusA-like endonuclease